MMFKPHAWLLLRLDFETLLEFYRRLQHAIRFIHPIYYFYYGFNSVNQHPRCIVMFFLPLKKETFFHIQVPFFVKLQRRVSFAY